MATPAAIIDLSSSEAYQEISRQLDDVIREDAVADAGRFVLNMAKLLRQPPNDVLRTQHPEPYTRYEELLALAYFVSLPARSAKEAVDLFERHFLRAYARLRTEVNIANKIHGLLVGTPGFTARDDLKRALRTALLRNAEVFTATPFQLEGKEVEPTLGNWLRYYLSVVGAQPQQGKLARAEFFQRDRAVLTLTQDERRVLQEVIEFFDDLSQSSQTPEGLEDRVTVVIDGKLQLYRNGFFEDLEKSEAAKVIRRLMPTQAGETASVAADRPTLPTAPARTQSDADRSAAIMAAYRGDPTKAQALLAEQQRLAPFVGTPGKLAAEFFAAVQRGKTLEVWAALLALASTGQLFDLLAQDEKLRTYLMAIWPKLYGPAATEAFARNSHSWQSIRLFLQYVLQERLRLPEAEAARIGAQVSNALQQATPGKYSAFAYYDVKTKAFRWMTGEAQK